MLHIFNNLEVPAGPFKSYSIYAGVQDAFMQWWYGHNAVAFFLTTPFLGLMYYFLPKAAERPVYSLPAVDRPLLVARLHLHLGRARTTCTTPRCPAWASTLGMLFSLMLWMPSWGGMINGLLTLRGAWNKVARRPVLKFFVVAITFYGMATFEGPLLSIKSVNALSHYTDWTIAHVHAGALGWNGFMTFGMIYWLMPRLFQTPLWSKKLMDLHFWIATIGILLYIVAIYAAGLTQGLMWRAFDDTGRLAYPDFVETTLRLIPMYWVRVVGGTLYLAGTALCGVNLLMTWQRRPAVYEEPVLRGAAPRPRLRRARTRADRARTEAGAGDRRGDRDRQARARPPGTGGGKGFRSRSRSGSSSRASPRRCSRSSRCSSFVRTSRRSPPSSRTRRSSSPAATSTSPRGATTATRR